MEYARGHVVVSIGTALVTGSSPSTVLAKKPEAAKNDHNGAMSEARESKTAH
jgi:hypothetical protein